MENEAVRDHIDNISVSATHIFTMRQALWIAERAKQQNRSKSAVVREALDDAMAKEESNVE